MNINQHEKGGESATGIWWLEIQMPHMEFFFVLLYEELR